ncbi:MAG: protein kinase [Deltaproteobacteria bacterium]|nr:protein kinase [Deltaproteobacteria bacterium]
MEQYVPGAGRTIGDRLRLDQRVAQDAFGEIWAGFETARMRSVVVRALTEDTAIAPGSSTAVLAIARGQTPARHRNLAEVVDLVFEQARWYLVSEPAVGETLASNVERGGPWPRPAVIHLAIELAEALQVLHAAGVPHGRLDPSRIVIHDGEIKIVDLGLGLLLGDDSEDWRTTMPNIDDPSIAFLSPEQAEGDGPPTVESDVWALGATLYYALTGHAPFSVKSRAALARATAKDRVAVGDLIDSPLADLIGLCLAREPVLRPTICEVLDAALAVLGLGHVENASSNPAIALDVAETEERGEDAPAPAAVVPHGLALHQKLAWAGIVVTVLVFVMLAHSARREQAQAAAGAGARLAAEQQGVSATPQLATAQPVVAPIATTEPTPEAQPAPKAAEPPQAATKPQPSATAKPRSPSKPKRVDDPFLGVTKPGF